MIIFLWADVDVDCRWVKQAHTTSHILSGAQVKVVPERAGWISSMTSFFFLLSSISLHIYLARVCMFWWSACHFSQFRFPRLQRNLWARTVDNFHSFFMNFSILHVFHFFPTCKFESHICLCVQFFNQYFFVFEVFWKKKCMRLGRQGKKN